MLVVLTILITIACILLTLIVLVQNPKGGGLGASFGGFSNQMMGVQRTTDFLEKATWTLATILIVFSLLSKFFVPHNRVGFEGEQPKVEGNQPVAPQTPQGPPTQPGN